MSRRRLSEAQCEQIAAMRERGDTYMAIANAFGMSEKAICWHCLRLGAERPKLTTLQPDYYIKCPVVMRGGHVVRAYTPDEDRRLIELSLAGKTDSEIGRALDRKSNSIRGRLMTLARREERGAA